eukprot:659549-Amphidinium_carterae.1
MFALHPEPSALFYPALLVHITLPSFPSDTQSCISTATMMLLVCQCCALFAHRVLKFVGGKFGHDGPVWVDATCDGAASGGKL